MKTETEINDEIRYTQGYLDGLRFALDKTEAETKEGVVTTQKDTHETIEREMLRLSAPIGITAGLATLFFGITLQPATSVGWFDIGAGIVLIVLGAFGARKYFRLLKESLE